MKEIRVAKNEILWGMIIGDGVDSYIESLIEDKQEEVRKLLEETGFVIIKQKFYRQAEGGKLYTWYSKKE